MASPPTIHGYCDPRFEPVRDEFAINFSERSDVGASFAATIEGEYVIDIWAGHRDADRTQPWEKDTIVNVFSTTKTMTALCALMLADRGELDFHAPVARYWPEYATNGKERTEVRHFMGHTAGLPGFGEQLTQEQLFDWDTVVEVLARQEPWWEPGAMGAYHAVTQGFLIGELVRRISGQSLGTFFRTEVAEPLQADFHIGLPAEQDARTADMLAAPVPDEPPPELPTPDWAKGRVPGMPNVMPPVTNSRGWRAAEIPAANGHANARAVVRVQSAMANGGAAFGKRLLSPAGCEAVFEVQTDNMAGMGVSHGIGYGLRAPMMKVPDDARICWWGGAGGSTIMVDMDQRACFSYVMNQMKNELPGQSRGSAMQAAFYRALRST